MFGLLSVSIVRESKEQKLGIKINLFLCVCVPSLKTHELQEYITPLKMFFMRCHLKGVLNFPELMQTMGNVTITEIWLKIRMGAGV